MDTIQLNVRISDELNEQIREIAFNKRVSKKELVTKYIEDGIRRETKQSTLDKVV